MNPNTDWGSFQLGDFVISNVMIDRFHLLLPYLLGVISVDVA